MIKHCLIGHIRNVSTGPLKNNVPFSEEKLDKEMYSQHYFYRILEMGTLSWGVFRGKPFTPSLMFAGKARAHLKEEHLKGALLG
jgi:hypothetical protein